METTENGEKKLIRMCMLITAWQVIIKLLVVKQQNETKRQRKRMNERERERDQEMEGD